MANGATSANSRMRRAGNSYMVTSHAVPTPVTTAKRDDTERHQERVADIERQHRCLQVPPETLGVRSCKGEHCQKRKRNRDLRQACRKPAHGAARCVPQQACSRLHALPVLLRLPPGPLVATNSQIRLLAGMGSNDALPGRD
jgi:hypothetical protein